MKELVLYYTPSPAPHVAKLKSVLVRMGVRIKNISPEQVNQTVGYLAGLPGFEECANQAAEFCEAEKLGKAEKSGETERSGEAEKSGEAGTLDKAAKLPVIPEEVLVMKNFTSRRIDELLLGLRKAGVPKIALKAIITEQNSKWTFYQLYEELREEHQAMSAPREEKAES